MLFRSDQISTDIRYTKRLIFLCFFVPTIFPIKLIKKFPDLYIKRTLFFIENNLTLSMNEMRFKLDQRGAYGQSTTFQTGVLR